MPAAIIPPAEEPDDEYPMVLTTGRQLEHWHTGAMTRRASVLDEIEPEAVASLAPADLRRLGIAAGEPDPRHAPAAASIELKARADSAVAAGPGLHPVLLRRGRRQHPDQPAARPVRQDPRVQVLRRQGRAGRGSRSRRVMAACQARLKRAHRLEAVLTIRLDSMMVVTVGVILAGYKLIH